MQDMQDFGSFGGMRSRLLGRPVVKKTNGLVGIGGHSLITLPSGVVVAASLNTTTVARSTDRGDTWSAGSIASAGSGWMGFAYGGGKLVTVANNDTRGAYSTNEGVSFTAVSMPGSTYNWYGCCYDATNGKFIAVGGAPGTMGAYSADGVSWTASTMPYSGIFTDVASLNGVAVAAGSLSGGTATANYARSTNGGQTWATGTFPVSLTVGRVKVLNGMIVAIGQNGSTCYVLTSKDGTSWSVYTVPSTVRPRDIDYGDGLWVIGIDGTGMPTWASTDLTQWYPVLTGAGSSDLCGGVVYAGGRFILPNDYWYTAANVFILG